MPRDFNFEVIKVVLQSGPYLDYLETHLWPIILQGIL